MSVSTTVGTPLDVGLVKNYFKTLVNQFFKILPMRENNEESLPVYLDSLRVELLGCSGIISDLEGDPRFLTLINIVQYLIDHPECSVKVTKREVFKAIYICNKLQTYISEGGVEK